MDLSTEQIVHNVQVLVANNNHPSSNCSVLPCESVEEVAGSVTLLQTMSSRKRKAEGELVRTASLKKRKTEGELAESRSSQKRKAEEHQEDEKPSKRSCLDTNGSEHIQTRTVLQSSSSVKSTAPAPAVGTADDSPMAWSIDALLNMFSPPDSTEGDVTPIDRRVHVHKSKRHFRNTYCQTKLLGEGSFGAVLAGIRRLDSLPVAIKHIPIDKVQYTRVKYKEKVYQEISEVVLMAQAAGRLCKHSQANPGVIRLLDVYKLKKEVLIVMEQPLNALDVISFYMLRQENIPEHELKSIFKQLVDASLLMHKNKVLHRDIKGENILVSLNHQFPSVKIIDFGCGDFVRDEPYRRFDGTLPYAPPEVFVKNQYEAEPTAVWQIGALLKHLSSKKNFNTMDYFNSQVHPDNHLSRECTNFMSKCLALNPCERPGLEELQRHPWLVR